MQRNMDLVRTILLWIENSPSGWVAPPFGIAGFTPEQVTYHAHIMMEDGLLESVGSAHPENSVYSLTWKGHEFLDLARDQKRWNQAKITIGKVGSAPISVWSKILQDLVLKDLGVAS
jgi:DNA-binding PadR family transcriptional regulator